MGRDRYLVNGLRSSAALHLARGIGLASRAWGQRGLGTIFELMTRVPAVGSARCRVEFAPGSFFETGIFEPYWAPTIIAHRPYEPELLALLHRLRGLDATFVDCGANFGYWAIVATGSDVGFKRAVAIEPNPSTYERLAANAKANGDRFVCLQNAVWDKDGERVTLALSSAHALAHVSSGGGSGIEIETTTIDSALNRLGWVDRKPVVLKIDVEGGELKAIAGARELRNRTDHLIVFEDFATDDFPNVRGLLGEGYTIAYVTEDGKYHPIPEFGAARRWVTSDEKIGRARNFVAVNPGGEFERRLANWLEPSA